MRFVALVNMNALAVVATLGWRDGMAAKLWPELQEAIAAVLSRFLRRQCNAYTASLGPPQFKKRLESLLRETGDYTS